MLDFRQISLLSCERICVKKHLENLAAHGLMMPVDDFSKLDSISVGIASEV